MANDDVLPDPWRLPHSFLFEGRRVRYAVAGSGPPVVFVHGTPWSSFNLRHLVRGLAPHYTTYVFDLLGFGTSDQAPGEVSLAIQGRLLSALLAHWNLEAPALVAHDIGGGVALRSHLLGGHPFSGLVLIDPVVLAPWGSPFFRHVRQHESALAGLPAFIHEAVVRAYISSAARRPLAAPVLESTISPWRGGAGQAAFYRQIAQADEKDTMELESRLGAVRCPCLVLWGEEDTWVPARRGGELVRRLPDARLELVSGAGHLVIEENPEALLAAIRSFCAPAPEPQRR